MLLLTALLAGSLAACREKSQGSGPGQTQPGASTKPASGQPAASELAGMDIAERIALGRELSQFSGTPLMESAPDALDLSRDGNSIFVHGQNRDSGDFFIVRMPVLEGNLGPGEVFFEDRRLLRAVVASHPRGKEVLGSSYYQSNPKAPVVDLISRYGPDLPEEAKGELSVPYNLAPGFPAAELQDAAMDISPYYNWVGDKIIVPLKQHGLCIVPVSGLNVSYVKYPEFEGGFTGMASGPLPDERRDQFLWLSMWRTGGGQDLCRLYLLDLQTQQWTEIVSLDWIVYRIGTSSIWDSPWLLSGSRSPSATDSEGDFHAPLEGQTGVRVPRLALLIPGSGQLELVPFQGNPVWEVGMEPTGRYVAYMDIRRHAMVRVEPASGKVDIDPRWWSDDVKVKVFVSEGGEEVFFWSGDILLRGKWSSHEDGTGYEEAVPDVENKEDDIQPTAADLAEDDPEAVKELEGDK